MTIDLYFRQAWTDERLKYDDGPIVRGGKGLSSVIWVPDTFFVNAIAASDHEITVPNTFVEVDQSGSVQMSTR